MYVYIYIYMYICIYIYIYIHTYMITNDSIHRNNDIDIKYQD